MPPGAGLELGASGRAGGTSQQPNLPNPWAAGAWQGRAGRGRRGRLCHGGSAMAGGQARGSALGVGGRQLSASQEKSTDLRQWRS